MKKLVILGFGGYGKTVEDIVLNTELYEEVVFLDDSAVNDKVLGKCDDFEKFIDSSTHIYPAFGNNTLRMQWIDKIITVGGIVPTIVHPKAYVSKTVTIDIGCVVLPLASINVNCTIGRGCIINFGAVIDHDVTLGEGCHICLNAVVKGYNNVPSLTKLEAGEVISNNFFK